MSNQPEQMGSMKDQGIKLAVFHKEGKVIIEFSGPLSRVGMNGNQAIDFGNALIKQGRKANKN